MLSMQIWRKSLNGLKVFWLRAPNRSNKVGPVLVGCLMYLRLIQGGQRRVMCVMDHRPPLTVVR